MYLCMLSPQLAAVCLGASALLWLVALRYGEFQRQSQRLTQDTLAGCNTVAEEVFSLSRIVRTFGTEAHEESRYQAWLQRLYDISIRWGRCSRLQSGGAAGARAASCRLLDAVMNSSLGQVSQCTSQQRRANVLRHSNANTRCEVMPACTAWTLA